MKDILFPIQFSSHAAEIFHISLSIANAFGARLWLSHVIGAPASPNEDPDYNHREATALSRLQAFDLAHRPKKYKHIVCEYLVEVGFPAAKILRCIDEQTIDLVIMDSQAGLSADGNLGHVSSVIVEKATCPVLLVPHKFKFKGFKQFCCTTDFTFDDLYVLNETCKWGESFAGKIDCIHVLQHDESVYTTKARIDLLREIFANKGNLMFTLGSGDTPVAIEAFVREKSADLLALAHHHHTFIARLMAKDTAREIADEISVPILIFNRD